MSGITRPCCGAHAKGFDRATGSVRLPHRKGCNPAEYFRRRR